jgi:putative CocE/NonD family hydrolase
VSPLTGNAFWEEVGPYPYLQNISEAGIATYFWSNLKDEPTAHVLLSAANLNGKLLIGPGSHCVAPPDYDLGGEVKRFFDYHLKGIENGIASEPQNTWWVENAPENAHWVRSDNLPGEQSVRQNWFLGTDNGGALAPLPQQDDNSSFTVDYELGEGEYFSFWVDAQDEHGPTFTSAPLQEALQLEGYPVVHLKLSADREDANVFVYLEEVDTEGEASVLAMGRLAAGYRKLAEAPFDTLGLPWHPGTEADYQPLVPGEPVSLDLSLVPVSRIVSTGHQLRVVVTGADRRQRNLDQIRQDPPPQLTLWFGGDDGSRISLPVRE